MVMTSRRTSGSLLRFLMAGCFAMLLLPPAARAAESGATEAGAERFLRQHCIRCHDGKVQEGQFRLDTLDRTFTSQLTAERWAEVMTRINAGEMPPEKEPRPTTDEIAGVVEWISGQLAAGEAARMASRGPMTHDRLSREEYANTISDLLGVRLDVTEPGVFNEDPVFRGFDRIGAMLSLAPSHVERYLAAADAVLARAYPEKPVESRVYRASGLHIRGTATSSEGRQKMAEQAAAVGVTDKVRNLIWPAHTIPGWATWWDSHNQPGVYRMKITLSGLRPKDGRVPHLSVWDSKAKTSLFDADVLADEGHPTTLEFERFMSMPRDLVLKNELPAVFDPNGHTVKALALGGGLFVDSRNHPFATPTGFKLFDDDGGPLFPLLVVDSVELEGPITVLAG